ncbi:MAG: hypothetical protein WDN75_15250 [Bacteroidota bacterium]
MISSIRYEFNKKDNGKPGTLKKDSQHQRKGKKCKYLQEISRIKIQSL